MFDPEYAKGNFPQPRPDWLARHAEPALDPGLPIVDAHHHFWEMGRAHIAELAMHDNLSVKLGGLGMPRIGFPFAQGESPPTSEVLARAWAPYLETCIEAFGADRCMFESNFPVDKGMCSYGVLWNAFKRVAGASVPTKEPRCSARLPRLNTV